MKILYLILNLFSISFNKIILDCKYEEINVIEYIYGDYKILEREADIEVLYKNERLELLDCKYNYKILYEKEVLTIFYKKSNNDYLNIHKYSKGKITSSIINNKFINTFDVILYKNNYLFVSSVIEYENEQLINQKNEKKYLDKRDAIILLIDKDLKLISSQVYGGCLNDYFSEIYFDSYNECIFITGTKEQNSGFDFGYGGNGTNGYFLVRIDEQLNVSSLLIFDEAIKNIEFDEYIDVYTSKHIFLFDYDLNQVSSLKFERESIFTCKMFGNYYASFGQNNVEIYDYYKNILIGSYDYAMFGGVDQVIIEGNYVLLRSRDKIYKSIFFDSSLKNKQFIYDVNEINYYDLNIIGIPNNFNIKKIDYEVGYDRSKFGTYKIILDYEYFTIDCSMQVLERCNVIDGYIYPLGYEIKFSGEAFLNGVEIANNYTLVEEGEYELKLIGKTEEKIINFNAYSMDIKYKDEDLKYWHYELEQNQELSLNIEYKGEYDVKEVVVNEESYEFENDLDNNLLTLKFKETKSGLYFYHINKIIYKNNENEYEENINYLLIIKILDNNVLLVNNYYNDEKEFVFETKIMNNCNVRYLKIQKDNDLSQYQYIPLKKGMVDLKEFSNEVDLVSLYIVYDVGGKLYEEKELFQLEYDFFEYENSWKMDFFSEGEYLSEIKIIINNDEKMKKIMDENETIFLNNIKTDYSYVFASVFLVLILFGISKTQKALKTKSKKNKKTNRTK